MSESVPPAFGSYQPNEPTLTEKLAWEFHPSVVKTINKGYGPLDYVPVAEVVVRLNKVLGVGNWSLSVDELQVHDSWVVCRVTLSALIGGQWVPYGAAGGHKDEKGDLGDAAKSAVSDATKKAASLMGVALYLARSPEALAYERRKKEEKAAS